MSKIYDEQNEMLKQAIFGIKFDEIGENYNIIKIAQIQTANPNNTFLVMELNDGRFIVEDMSSEMNKVLFPKHFDVIRWVKRQKSYISTKLSKG